ncbi:MAG: hypothetical protein HYW25_03525 [Candidatus Aenigmarchaeota archaeon]|nr:hypothetical protein [Candidatus Aenigmarchaeota archaeon]
MLTSLAAGLALYLSSAATAQEPASVGQPQMPRAGEEVVEVTGERPYHRRIPFVVRGHDGVPLEQIKPVYLRIYEKNDGKWLQQNGEENNVEVYKYEGPVAISVVLDNSASVSRAGGAIEAQRELLYSIVCGEARTAKDRSCRKGLHEGDLLYVTTFESGHYPVTFLNADPEHAPFVNTEEFVDAVMREYAQNTRAGRKLMKRILDDGDRGNGSSTRLAQELLHDSLDYFLATQITPTEGDTYHNQALQGALDAFLGIDRVMPKAVIMATDLRFGREDRAVPLSPYQEVLLMVPFFFQVGYTQQGSSAYPVYDRLTPASAGEAGERILGYLRSAFVAEWDTDIRDMEPGCRALRLEYDPPGDVSYSIDSPDCFRPKDSIKELLRALKDEKQIPKVLEMLAPYSGEQDVRALLESMRERYSKNPEITVQVDKLLEKEE